MIPTFIVFCLPFPREAATPGSALTQRPTAVRQALLQAAMGNRQAFSGETWPRLGKFNGHFSSMPVAAAQTDYTILSFGQILNIAKNNSLIDFYFASQGYQNSVDIRG
jgi:hypothetical protein